MKITAGGALALATCTIALAPTAQARALAPVTVTIKAAGVDLYGTVKSPQHVCMAHRTVVVYKQIGTRGGGDDRRIASDTTSIEHGVGVWDTGNTGIAGRFYAKVKASADCRGATSPTIRAVRNP